jgi:hypothetical protein
MSTAPAGGARPLVTDREEEVAVVSDEAEVGDGLGLGSASTSRGS